MDQTPDHLKNFIAYALWGVDKRNVFDTEEQTIFESLDKINEKYGSETAILLLNVTGNHNNNLIVEPIVFWLYNISSNH